MQQCSLKIVFQESDNKLLKDKYKVINMPDTNLRKAKIAKGTSPQP